jgi:hypothetical protein
MPLPFVTIATSSASASYADMRSIFGSTTEIQKEIIARGLGL